MLASRIRNELPLIVASLFIAGVIWLIAKQSDYERDRLQSAVVMTNVPPTLTVSALPDKVGVLVQYPKRISNLIVERNFSVPINVAKLFGDKPEEGWDPRTPIQEKEVHLTPGSVKSDLDPSVQVVTADPDVLVLQARLRTQEARVEVATQGQLPGNLMLVGIRPEPAKVTYSGSAEALKKLADVGAVVRTEPIDLTAVHAPGRQFTCALQAPHPGLVLLGLRTVQINVAVTEKPVRQEIKAVPIALVTFAPNLKAVVEPSTASVVLEGPASAVGAIGAKDIEFSPVRELQERPGRVYEIGIEARLKTTVAAEVMKQVKIVEAKPSRISVEFVPVDTQNK